MMTMIMMTTNNATVALGANLLCAVCIKIQRCWHDSWVVSSRL